MIAFCSRSGNAFGYNYLTIAASLTLYALRIIPHMRGPGSVAQNWRDPVTPDERNLIMGLFDRMRAQGAIQKEYEAENLINTEVRKIPDSAYMLVQSVLVGEQTLAQAGDRIQQLETRVRDLEAAVARGSSAPASSGGGFLGGLFGGGSRSQPATSVPVSRAPANSPWGQPAQPMPPQYQQAPPQQGYAPKPAAAHAKTAAATKPKAARSGINGRNAFPDKKANATPGRAGLARRHDLVTC